MLRLRAVLVLGRFPELPAVLEASCQRRRVLNQAGFARRLGPYVPPRRGQGDLAPDAVERIAVWTAEAPFDVIRVDLLKAG